MTTSCPRCHIAMSVSTFEGRLKDTLGQPIMVSMDQCRRCDGYWFDRLEAETTMGLSRKLTEQLDQVREEPLCHRCHNAYPAGTPKCPECDVALTLDCPHCMVAMKQVEVRGITLDLCTGCEGFWFDASELKLLHTALEAEQARSPATDTITCSQCGRGGLKERDTFYASSGLVCAYCHSNAEVRSMNARALEEERRYRHDHDDGRYDVAIGLGEVVDFLGSIDFD